MMLLGKPNNKFKNERASILKTLRILRRNNVSDNIYAAPSSNLNVRNRSRGNPTKAIIFGLLISMVGSIVGAILIGIAFGIYWTSIGIGSDQIASLSQTATSILVAYLIMGCLFSTWSGYYVAKKTNYREYRHCVIMAISGTLLSVMLFVAMPSMAADQPLWYTVTSFIYYPIAVLYGCWLFVKSKT